MQIAARAHIPRLNAPIANPASGRQFRLPLATVSAMLQS
jgi:hypothetical protein